MVTLPFRAVFKPNLVAHLRDEYLSCVRSDTLPSISPFRISYSVGPHKSGWMLVPVPKEEALPDCIFAIDDFLFYASPYDQRALCGYTLDFVEGEIVQTAWSREARLSLPLLAKQTAPGAPLKATSRPPAVNRWLGRLLAFALMSELIAVFCYGGWIRWLLVLSIIVTCGLLNLVGEGSFWGKPS